MMNLAKMSTNGQITIPVEVRRELKLKAGDKLIFFREQNGKVTMQNINTSALQEMQKTATSQA